MRIMATIDVAAFNAAFAAALPEHTEKQVAKAEKKLAGAPGFAGLALPSPETIAAGQATFCAAWPEVRGTINTVLNMVGWLMPGATAKVKAFLTAFDATIVPVICKK
jgi:hypothetical protein